MAKLQRVVGALALCAAAPGFSQSSKPTKSTQLLQAPSDTMTVQSVAGECFAADATTMVPRALRSGDKLQRTDVATCNLRGRLRAVNADGEVFDLKDKWTVLANAAPDDIQKDGQGAIRTGELAPDLKPELGGTQVLACDPGPNGTCGLLGTISVFSATKTKPTNAEADTPFRSWSNPVAYVQFTGATDPVTVYAFADRAAPSTIPPPKIDAPAYAKVGNLYLVLIDGVPRWIEQHSSMRVVHIPPPIQTATADQGTGPAAAAASPAAPAAPTPDGNTPGGRK